MITITGNYSEAKIFTNQETIDNGSIGSITALCNSPVSEGNKIRIMPDFHPGRGSIIGLSTTFTDKIIPNIVGIDIGCGMLVQKFRVNRRIEFQRLDSFIRQSIPNGRRIYERPLPDYKNVNLDKLFCVNHIQIDKAHRSIGTLSGGNHFIEIDRFDDDYYLIIHSGSRHLGVEIAEYYQTVAYSNCKGTAPYELSYLEGFDMKSYIHDAHIAEIFARVNRKTIAKRITSFMKFNVIDEFETVHNYIDGEEKIIRKGAVSAKEGERIIIPINASEGSLLCTGLGNEEWNNSAPHGSGRKYSRLECRNNFTLSTFKESMKGVYSSSIKSSNIDECPDAYRNMNYIAEVIADKTVKIDQIIKPIYNFKEAEDIQ